MEDIKRRKKKVKSKFWFGYRIYVLVLVVLLVAMCIAVWNKMKKYEATQPENIVEEIVAKLKSGDFSDVTTTASSNKFEEPIDVTSYLEDTFCGKNLSYKANNKSYNSLAPVYDVMDGETAVATISLKSVKKHKMLAILDYSDWEITSIEPIIATGNYTLTIKAPDSYKITVNGVEIGKDERVGEAVKLSGFDYVEKYVTIPSEVTYSIKGLNNVPEISVNGTVVSEDKVTVGVTDIEYSASFETEAIPEELAAYVINAAKTYSNYFSKDLDGCSVSTAPIAYLFPADSDYIQMAEQYRQTDMWMYSAHQPPVFTNEQAINYTKYGDNCFSVEVIFDKSMILTLNGQERVDHNDQVYYYVNIDGNWLIADMRESVK